MKKNNPIHAELYRLGELPPSWQKETDEALLREEAEKLARSDREILDRYPPAAAAAKIRARLEGENVRTFQAPSPSRKGRFVLLPAAAALLLTLLLPLLLFREEPLGESPEITRFKGSTEPELLVYRQQNGITEVLERYGSAEEADLIQLAYRIGAPRYGAILSVDGRGMVTRHLPEAAEQAVQLEPGGEKLLPYSYELDDAPDYETFYLITSDKPFPLSRVIDTVAGAAREGRDILDIPEILQKSGLSEDLTGNIHQYAVPITKED